MDRAARPSLRAPAPVHPPAGSSRVSCRSVRSAWLLLQLDLDVDTGGEVELAERINGLLGRLQHVEQPLVRTNLEMLARLLVNMGRAVNRKALDPGRQRDRTSDAAPGAPDSIDDFAHRLIEQAVVVRLETYAYLVVHPEYRARCSSAHLLLRPTFRSWSRRRSLPCGHLRESRSVAPHSSRPV